MLVALVVFVAAIIQGVMGFGSALIAMPLLVPLVGIQTATPAYALLVLLATILNAIRWRAHITPRDLTQLILPALAGIPLGAWLLTRAPENSVTAALGVILIGYAVYSLLGLALPPLRRRIWAYIAGFTSGVLSGAYNAGGPPVIVYATARGWPADRFRANLQAYFVVISVTLVLSHAAMGHFTPGVLRTALIGLPAMLAGQLLSAQLTRYIDQRRFRQLVLIVLLLLGVSLLLA